MLSGGSGTVEFLPVHSQLNKAVSRGWEAHALLRAGTWPRPHYANIPSLCADVLRVAACSCTPGRGLIKTCLRNVVPPKRPPR